MPIQPSIPLAAIGTQPTPSALRPIGEAVAIRGGLQKQRLYDLELAELEERRAGRQALRDVYRQHTPGSPEFMRAVGAIDPALYQAELKAQGARQKQEKELLKLDAELAKLQRDEQADILDQTEEMLTAFDQQLTACIELGDTPEGQRCYERTKQQTEDRIQALDIDDRVKEQVLARVRSLPPDMNLQQLIALQRENMDAGERLQAERQSLEYKQKLADIETEAVKQREETLRPGRVEEARQKAEVTEPSRMRVAQARGVQAAERQATGMIRAAEIEKGAKPLAGATAKSVAELNTTLEMIDDLESLFDPRFTGPIVGRAYPVREITGQVEPEEVEFHRLVADIRDTLLRARSGAAITVPEYNRLIKIVPDPNLPGNVFASRLRGFRRSVRQLRDQKLRVATTGRGQLREEAEQEVAPTPNDPLGIRD